jgi:hypothetical protein
VAQGEGLSSNPSTAKEKKKKEKEKKKGSVWAWWCTTIIPVTWDDRDRRILNSRPTRAKLGRPHLKNKIQTEGLGVWLRGWRPA